MPRSPPHGVSLRPARGPAARALLVATDRARRAAPTVGQPGAPSRPTAHRHSGTRLRTLRLSQVGRTIARSPGRTRLAARDRGRAPRLSPPRLRTDHRGPGPRLPRGGTRTVGAGHRATPVTHPGMRPRPRAREVLHRSPDPGSGRPTGPTSRQGPPRARAGGRRALARRNLDAAPRRRARRGRCRSRRAQHHPTTGVFALGLGGDAVDLGCGVVHDLTVGRRHRLEPLRTPALERLGRERSA